MPSQNDAPQPNYYSVLTAEVRYSKDLTPLQKLLFSEITALSNREGHCWASNAYFAKLYNVTENWISISINKMIKLGFLEGFIDTEKGNIRYLAIKLKSNTYLTKIKDPYLTKVKYPYLTKVKHNNTSINNINKNNKINITEASSVKIEKSVKKERNLDVDKVIQHLKDRKDTVDQFTGTAFLGPHVKQGTNAYSSDSKKTAKLENKMRYLLEIPDSDLKQLSEVYLASIPQVKEKGEALYDWCLAGGRRKKNYKAFLQGALRRDYGKRQLANVRAEYQPLLATEEVRDEGLDFRSLIKH